MDLMAAAALEASEAVGGCGGGFGGFDGFDGGRGCGCGFRDRVKTKFFNIRGCVAERCGGGRGGWWD